MNELRKDYILERYVIIATDRGKRPHQFKTKEAESKEEVDYFAPGNESKTPSEIERVPDGKGSWKLRVFPNMFAATKPEGDYNIKTDNEFYTYSSAYGYHEIIVETPDKRQLWDLSKDEIKTVLELIKKRFNAIKSKDGIKYVCLFKNHKQEAGCSIAHSHFQLISTNHIPCIIQEKIDAVKRLGGDPYDKIIAREKDSYRRAFENNSIIAFCPYASRFPFELLILPKQYASDINSVNLDDLSEVLQKTLAKLKDLNAPFNMVFHYSPTQKDGLRFQIEVLPRLATWAGFEFFGTIINTMPPEEAAKFYRGE